MERRPFLAPAETWRTGLSVPALSAENVAQAVLYMVHDSLGPGKWGHWVDTGFEWIPYRTLHRITVSEIEASDDSSHLVLMSDFILGTYTDPDHGLIYGIGAANLINQMSPTASCWFDTESRTLHLVTRVRLDVKSWWEVDLFLESVQRLVAFAEFLNVRLAAETLGYTPASFERPEKGLRETPDPLVQEWGYDLGEPEAVSGLWFSEEEIRRFIGTMRLTSASAEDEVGIGSPDQTELEDYTPDLGQVAMERLRFDFQLPEDSTGRPLARVSFGPALHPELGYGIQRLVSIRLFAESAPMNLPEVSMRAAFLANELNGEMSSIPTDASGLGAWVAWGDQLHHATYLRHQPLRMLCHRAQGRVGDVLSTMCSLRMAGSLVQFVLQIASAMDLTSARISEDEWNWAGIQENAFKWSLWSERSAATEDIISTCPTNQLLDEPLEISRDHDLYEFRRDLILAVYGVFNPLGPSVGSLEVLIDYVTQNAILVDRIRHPFGPSLRVHAVVDREGFDMIGQLAGQVLEQLDWSGIDWCEIRYDEPEQREFLLTGLYNFGRRVLSDADSARNQANALLGSANNPWERLDPEARFPVVLDGEDPWIDWLAVVSSPLNVDAHNAFLRSAWEGARAFRASTENNAEEASRIQGLCFREVAIRRGDLDPRE